MAIARVTGAALADNLERTANIAVDTSTLFVDVIKQQSWYWQQHPNSYT